MLLVSLEHHGRAFPLKIDRYHINIAVNNQLTTTKINQVFINPNNFEVDGIYIFPVPDDAALSNFALSIDEEPVTGQLLSHEESRRIYRSSVRQRYNTAIIEYIGTRAFVADVPNIPANGERHIEFEYSQIIPVDNDQVKYTYPLSLAKGAVAPNAGRLDIAPITNLLIEMKIESDSELRTIYSPSHEVTINRKDDHHAHIRYKGKNIEPHDDFQCYYSISDDDFGITLLTHRADESEEGYFMLLVSPKYEVKKTDIIEKDFVFVLDHSGSMAPRRKIKQAKAALRYCVQNLNDGDRFNLILFNKYITSLSDRLIDVKDGREEALLFIEDIQARGSTNINDALLTALAEKPDPNRPRIIVFLTDGRPTASVMNESRILENIAKANSDQARIFVFGVGSDVNRRLLDKIAADNGGTRNYVEPREDIEEAVSSLFRKMNEPVLVNVELDFGQIITKELSPSNLPDMFRKEQLTLFGRYENHGGTVLKIRGSIGNELHEFTKNMHFTELEMDNDFLPQLWAQRRIAELVDQEALDGYNEERRKEIKRLSIEHDVVTPYTRFYRSDSGSWVFVSDDIDTAYTPGNKPKDDAVIDSKRIEYQKRSMHKIGYEDIKTYGRKTFYRHGRVWIDTKYDGQSECKIIVFGSEEYFDLAAHSHELAKYFKLSPSMIICHKGVNYQITPPRSFSVRVFSNVF